MRIAKPAFSDAADGQRTLAGARTLPVSRPAVSYQDWVLFWQDLGRFGVVSPTASQRTQRLLPRLSMKAIEAWRTLLAFLASLAAWSRILDELRLSSGEGGAANVYLMDEGSHPRFPLSAVQLICPLQVR